MDASPRYMGHTLRVHKIRTYRVWPVALGPHTVCLDTAQIPPRESFVLVSFEKAGHSPHGYAADT